jgi:DNA topoisomerase-2
MEEQKYQKLEHAEHIYKLPDTYIGSIESTTEEMFVFNQDKMVKQKITYVPGFFKIFDEILVNAIDHRQRDPSVKNIKIEIKKGTSEIIIQNDGNGIDVAIHPILGIYIPEMLFGHLLTSSNYNDKEKRTTGGKNGYGATLVAIFSTYFIVETIDAVRQLKYTQYFTENNKTIHKPVIKTFTGKPYTKIKFCPDYKKFGLDQGITDDMYALLERRVYDTTATTPEDLNIYLNSSKLKIKSMEKYIQLYISPGFKIFYEQQPRWKVGLVLSPNHEFNQMSFVNGIWTSKGGRHVDYILNSIVDKIRLVLGKLPKTKNKAFKPSQIKDHIWLFVDSIIENPSFSSQTKEEMTTRSSQFGSECKIDEKWVEKWMKHQNGEDSFISRMIQHTRIDEEKLLKKTDGTKRNIIRGIPKLEDAVHAGTRNSYKCTLILTEGDSAKSSILAGVSALGSERDYYGIFPLRGKFINVREMNIERVNNNEEVKNLKNILGLQHGKVYTKENLKELRYGSISICADSDVDGHHIKGLIMNFLHYFWPSLLSIEGFLKTYYTPIIKGFYKNQSVSFYTLQEYNQFRETQIHKNWTFKYYKGLGTSTSKEFKEYFQQLSKITSYYTLDSEQELLLAFSKDKADQRKEWLKMYDPEEVIQSKKEILISDFIHKELKHFSNYDNHRSIPNALDGLKPSQRKVLYGILKRPKQEIKVAQLASYVSETTNYHHGEVSLEQTIVGMSQYFIGKNNLPLLKGIGQFGTRIMGGKDNAQSRYIFTETQDYTRNLFCVQDDPLLDYLVQEDKQVEPFCYYPLLPMVLINGSEGIGTGYSSFVPCFNAKEILEELLQKNQNNEPFKENWIPYYKNYTGYISSVDDSYRKFSTTGSFGWKTDNILLVKELPIGLWTNTFKEHLEHLIEQGVVNNYINKSTDEHVHFEITISKPEKLLDREVLIKTFKLQTTLSLNNMYLYRDQVIHKFQSVNEILEHFYEQRLEMYVKRKEYVLKNLKEQINLLDEKIRFIQLVLDNPDVIFRRTKKEIYTELQERMFTQVDSLIQLPIYNWSTEKIKEYTQDLKQLNQQYDIYNQKTIQELYTEDLLKLKEKLN